MMVQAESIWFEKLKDTKKAYNSKSVEFILPKSLLKMQDHFVQISIAQAFDWVLFPLW